LLYARGRPIPAPDGRYVGILIDPPLDIDAALKRVKLQKVGNCRVLLASIEDMIILKEKTGRAQDRADIEHLRRLTPKR
jgi:predicted nucleotidyltransferase